MGQIKYSSADLPQVPGARVAIVMSKWYREFSDAMCTKCLNVLQQAGCEGVPVHVVPGSLEIPLAVRRLLKIDPLLEAVIVFGVILKGDTYHFEMVKNLTMSGLERVMFEFDTPIINEILAVDTLDFVRVRSADDERNKGLEAARAAAEIISWRRSYPLEER
jgi:6,7-dimethyl-8-ribityllumazine synthase